MTLNSAVLDALQAGPLSRPEIECAVIAAGFAPAGVPRVLWQLKKAGSIVHTQRGGRYRRSLYARTT